MNKTSITIQSKIDGSVVFDSTEDRYKKTIPAGIPVMDVIDDSLDSFTFTVKDVLRRKPFQPFDLVTFTITDDTHTEKVQYFVLNDNAKTYRNIDRDVQGYPRSTYEHTIACVETTKYLEKIKVFELTMTNRHDTLLDQFKKAMNNIEPPIGVGYDSTVSMTSPSRFSMTGELAALLKGVESCDFSFQNTDARTIFDEILARVNARVVVHNVDFDLYGRYAITLGYHLLDVATDVVPIWELGGHGQIVHEEMGSDGQDYAGTIVARGYNSIPDEPLMVRVIPTSTHAQFSVETALLSLPFPISNRGIKSIKCERTFSYTEAKRINSETLAWEHSAPFYIRSLVDLTQYIIPMEEYDLLPADDKKKRIAYSIGENKIMLGATYSNWIGITHSTFKDILDEAVQNHKTILHSKICGCKNPDNPALQPCKCVGLDDKNDSYIVDSETMRPFEFIYQIEYYPLYDTVASIQKSDNDNLSLMAVMDSQTEQTLDISRHGKKLSGLLKRVGNDSYVVDVKAQTYSGLLSLLSRIDVDGEKYVLYKREYAVYNDFVNCRYYFSQNYTAVQENAGINRERQIFPIPTEYNETPIVIRGKLEFSTDETNGDEPSKSLSVDIAKAAAQTLVDENNISSESKQVVRGRLRYLLFRPELYSSESERLGPKENYMLPLSPYALGNTINFIASPLDNYSVSFSGASFEFSIWGDGGRHSSYNPYVETTDEKHMGETDSFRLRYAFGLSLYDSWITYTSKDDEPMQVVTPVKNYEDCEKLLPNTYPIVEIGQVCSAMVKNESGSNYFAVDYKKDRMQKPLFVLSLSVTVAEEDKERLFVKPIFAKMNNLVRDNGDGLEGLQFFIAYDKTFSEDDDFVDKEFIVNPASLDFSVETTGQFATLTGLSQDHYEGTYGEYTAWGICDKDGRLYLAVNGKVCPIYLAVKDC